MVCARTCADTTGSVGSWLSGRKAPGTVDSPRTVRWHMQEGDAAVLICIVCLLVLQGPAGRPWEPDAEPAGEDVGLDTLPPGQLIQ